MMMDLRVGSLWASIKLAIELQYLELSIFSVAREYRLATSQGQSVIAHCKYTDKNSNIRCARGEISLPAGGYFYLIWLGGEKYERGQINKSSINTDIIIRSVTVLSLRIAHSWQENITT